MQVPKDVFGLIGRAFGGDEECLLCLSQVCRAARIAVFELWKEEERRVFLRIRGRFRLPSEKSNVQVSDWGKKLSKVIPGLIEYKLLICGQKRVGKWAMLSATWSKAELDAEDTDKIFCDTFVRQFFAPDQNTYNLRHGTNEPLELSFPLSEIDRRLTWHFKSIHAFIIMYSPSMPASLDEAIFFLNSIRLACKSLVLPCVLVANKMDLGGSISQGKGVALHFGVPFFEHSIFKDDDWQKIWLAAIKIGHLSVTPQSAEKSDAKCVVM